jgi:parallel beta-helix repeat protein
MVAPNFKKITDTNPDNPSIYEASDLRYAFDVLDGTHPTDRIQAVVIEGLQKPFRATVRAEGSSFVARNRFGAILQSGSSSNPTLTTAALQGALNQGGRIYIGPGTYNIDATLLVPSNTHVQADVNAVIRGPAHPNALAGLIKNENQSGSAPQINDSYIIIEGGTWDGNAEFDVNVPSTMTQGTTIIGNIHLFLVAFGWVNRVRSLNSLGENIKIRSCDRSWVTNCYCSKARLDDTGSGRAGIMVTSLGGREAICDGNIIDNAGGEAIGVNRTCDRVIVTNNICRVTQAGNGRGYILLESVGDPTAPQIIKDCVVANNVVNSSYQCIHIRSSNGVVVANNTLRNIGAGAAVGEASAGGEGIRLVGDNNNIVITGNYIHDTEYDGMLCTGGAQNLIISNNIIRNVARGATNTYDGITFELTGTTNYNNVKVANNHIIDDRGTPRMRHGINFGMNQHSMHNAWFQGNTITGETGDNFHFGWDINERFTGEVRFLGNSGINTQGKITKPFNNSHNQVGIQLASPSTFSYAAGPSASTAYGVVASPIALTATGGTGVQITVKERSGIDMMTNVSTPLYNVFMQVGWTVNFGAFSGAPTVQVVAL